MSRCAFSGLALSISSLPISPTRRPKRWKIETNLAPLADYKHGKRNLESFPHFSNHVSGSISVTPSLRPRRPSRDRFFPMQKKPLPRGQRVDNRNPVTFFPHRLERTTLFPRKIFRYPPPSLWTSGERERIGEEEASSGRAWEERRNLRSRFSRREEGRSLGYTRERRSVNGNSRKRVEGTAREREREKRSKGGSLGQTQCFPLFLCHPPSDSLPRATFILSLSPTCHSLLREISFSFAGNTWPHACAHGLSGSRGTRTHTREHALTLSLERCTDYVTVAFTTVPFVSLDVSNRTRFLTVRREEISKGGD